ncbi:hypothetical protein [Methylorubrum podarium]
MVREKVSAFIEASGLLMTGGSCDAVVARYHKHVAVNARRLTAT